MLPNMTSSKSSRASNMPSSLSLPILQTTSSFREKDLSFGSASSSPIFGPDDHDTVPRSRRKLRRKKSGLGRLATLSYARPPSPERLVMPGGKIIVEAEPVPPRPVHRKARTWGTRVSSFLPSLITKDLDAPPQTGSLRRKPVAQLSKASPPTPDLAPPPYMLHDPSIPNVDDQVSATASPSTPTRLPLRPIEPDAASNLSSAFSSRPVSRPGQSPLPPPPSQAAPAPPIQPSSGKRRSTLTKQDPAARAESQRSSSSTIGGSSRSGDSPTQKLQKEQVEARIRRGSLPQQGGGRLPPSMPPLNMSPTPASRPDNLEPRERRNMSVQLPAPQVEPRAASRVSSLPVNPPQVTTTIESGRESPSGGRLRRSFMPGNRSRSSSADASKNNNTPYAWVMSDGSHAEYNPTFLTNGEKVPELWNESGDVLVYLYPRGSGCGPSFRVMEFTVSSSYVFHALIQSGGGLDPASAMRRGSSASASTPPDSPGQMKLYLPTAPPSADAGQLSTPGQVSDSEMDRLIAIRNLFAFLTGQPLVATKVRPTVFQAFIQISALLEEFGFASPDGTSFGSAVDLSFEFYMDQLGLSDCRHSREKTVEALVLGERMRNTDLYNEAFAHTVGKYAAIMDLKLPLFDQVSQQTRLQLERAHFDLVNRQQGVNQHLEQFDFPSLFAGVANSSSNSDLKHVRFKAWRNSFNKMRSLVLGHYKSTFGSWPPKASSSKNPFAESGLNRLVLKTLYSDMCALYDLLVDRNNLTTRIIDEAPPISSEPSKTAISALRCMLSEFDRSRPPVLPPIPYDVPQMPTMSSILETYPTLSTKEQIKFEKSIKDNEMMLVLNKAYNYDANKVRLPFLDKFREFELREARGKMAPDLLDQRIGYWLFLYVVIQSLPMLVVDAPGLKFSEGTEYFLCEPPMGNPPWMENRQVRKMWYEVAGGGGLVELSTDAVLFSIEATYHRSHCWLAAKRWDGVPDVAEPPFEEPGLGPLEPPPPVLQGDDSFGGLPPPARGTSPGTTPPPTGGSAASTLRPRNLSPGGSRASRMSHAYRSSMAMGLEPVPLEVPAAFGNRNRSSSLGPRPGSGMLGSRTRSVGNLAGVNQQDESPTGPNTGATFDDILGETEKKPAPKKKGFFF